MQQPKHDIPPTNKFLCTEEQNQNNLVQTGYNHACKFYSGTEALPFCSLLPPGSERCVVKRGATLVQACLAFLGWVTVVIPAQFGMA